MATTGSKKNAPLVSSSDRPAARQSKSKGSGGEGDGALHRPVPSPVPLSRSNNSQMAAKRDAAAEKATEKLAADRLARETRLDARRQKKPAAVGGDGPPERAVSIGQSVSSSSVQSGGDPEPSESVHERASPLDTDSSSGGGTATAPPAGSVATTEASATPSQTPSLASVMNPASSISGNQSARSDRTSDSSTSALLQGRGVLGTESVSQFLSHLKDQRIFVSACADSDILDEDLSVSLLKFHPVYDPLRDDDPLLSYGSVDGVLPGKMAEETMVLRDIIMHWAQPHINLNWETLEEGIQSPRAVEAHHVALPASPAPGSDTSKVSMPVNPPIDFSSKEREAPALKYPVPPSLTAAPLGPRCGFRRMGPQQQRKRLQRYRVNPNSPPQLPRLPTL
ncbi:hypothetical protein DFH08DRAFT_820533 [Mycena albidolilacea]|uniref:Uncharacterized protein n=1 Tax=Mycena albidolilacea TaxID=1033008 RepID=A0AAD6ZD34_9AGAR|nr:hypothetical protein DFH08DRAFT_820533 [Mycena albidolilacea]